MRGVAVRGTEARLAEQKRRRYVAPSVEAKVERPVPPPPPVRKVIYNEKLLARAKTLIEEHGSQVLVLKYFALFMPVASFWGSSWSEARVFECLG